MPSRIALQLEGHDGKAVQEDHKVNTLIIAGPDLLHNGEDVFLILRQQLPVEGGRRFCIHELQLHIGELNTVLQDVQQAATGLCSFSIDEADDGVLQIALVDFTECRHLVRLGIVQELKQHLPVNGKEAVIVRRFADHITIILREPVHYEMLVFFFA